jgi:hypothetical protein
VAATAVGWLDARRAANADAVLAAEASVEDLSARLRAAVRTLHAARAGRRALAELSAADLERDAALLAKLPGVAVVGARDDAVLLTTGPLTIDHGGVVRAVGSFRIELSPVTGVRVFRVEAPPGVRVAWIHPHVQADLPCLGSARVGVEKLLGDLQLVAAAEVMLRFLETYDADTAYCDVSAWPAVATVGGPG